jgi:hypothetical protein
MRPDVAFVYVRELLTTITGERTEPDDDGDLPVRFNGAQFFVRIVGSKDPWVQVFSVAMTDAVASPELFDELNSINRDMRFARAFFVNGQVLIESEIWADDVNPANFQHACANIAGATDAFTPALTSHGGRAMFEASKSDDYETPTFAMGFTSGPFQ